MLCKRSNIKSPLLMHLCTYYIGNKLYKNLFVTLADLGVTQKIYIPVRKSEQCGKNFFEHCNTTFMYDYILRSHDRYLYFNKINKQMRALEALPNDLRNVQIIHAHTLFSDGGTAYLLKKKF